MSSGPTWRGAGPGWLRGPASHPADERLRRRTAEALVAGCGLAVAATLLLTAPAAAMVMGDVAGGSAYVEGRLLPSCAPAWWAPVRWVLVAATPVALGVLVWCAAVLLVPAGRHDVGATT